MVCPRPVDEDDAAVAQACQVLFAGLHRPSVARFSLVERNPPVKPPPAHFPAGNAAIMSSSMRAPGVESWFTQIVVLAGVQLPKYSLRTATMPS